MKDASATFKLHNISASMVGGRRQSNPGNLIVMMIVVIIRFIISIYDY